MGLPELHSAIFGCFLFVFGLFCVWLFFVVVFLTA